MHVWVPYVWTTGTQMGAISLQALGAAISQAIDLEFSTVAVKRLVKLAEAVRSLREEMLAQRWPGVQAAVSAIDDMDAEKARKAKLSRVGRVLVGRRATRMRGRSPPRPPPEPAPEESLARGLLYMSQVMDEDDDEVFELPPVTKREVEMAQDEVCSAPRRLCNAARVHHTLWQLTGARRALRVARQPHDAAAIPGGADDRCCSWSHGRSGRNPR